MIRVLPLVLAALVLATPVAGQSRDTLAGMQAYNAGDIATACRCHKSSWSPRRCGTTTTDGQAIGGRSTRTISGLPL